MNDICPSRDDAQPHIVENGRCRLCLKQVVNMEPKYRIVNTWNGGKGGRQVVFTSTNRGDQGHNECFKWFHRHTSFSYHEATTNQGYVVEPFYDNLSL